VYLTKFTEYGVPRHGCREHKTARARQRTRDEAKGAEELSKETLAKGCLTPPLPDLAGAVDVDGLERRGDLV